MVCVPAGKLYLFVAIDRTSKFAFAELYEAATVKSAVGFLRALIKAVNAGRRSSRSEKLAGIRWFRPTVRRKTEDPKTHQRRTSIMRGLFGHVRPHRCHWPSRAAAPSVTVYSKPMATMVLMSPAACAPIPLNRGNCSQALRARARNCMPGSIEASACIANRQSFFSRSLVEAQKSSQACSRLREQYVIAALPEGAY